jgi:hypothetical protein
MPSIVPASISQATYQVLDDLGKYGHVWSELAETEANEETIVQWIIAGQFKHPLRVISIPKKAGLAT